MLSELRVKDLGVIAEVTVPLATGMTALTGETGAGKTLLIEALSLVLGERATPSLVRSGAVAALVEARFFVDDSVIEQELHAEDDAEEFEVPMAGSEGEHILAREVPANGRSRGYVDGKMATASVLAALGGRLVDIHGQGEQESLLHAEAQRRALDQFARIDTSELEEARNALRALEREAIELGGDPSERARQIDVLGFQLEEITNAMLDDPDEEARLEANEALLANAQSLREAAAAGVSLLAGQDQEVTGSRSVADSLGSLLALTAGKAWFAEWEVRVRGLVAEVDDLAAEMRGSIERFDDDPEALQAIQERRRLLRDLRRKYGDTIDEIVEFGERARERLVELEGAAERIDELDEQRARLSSQLAACSAHVRAARLAAAPRLADAVTARLTRLAMPGARVAIEVGDDPAGDNVSLLLAANPGEPLAPLAKVASGGELSRMMLALRLEVGGGAPTMLFDEVDAGVGGAAALTLAEALAEVADGAQVLVVTHLAQVAAFADHQILVEKVVDDSNRTITTVRALDGEERVAEIARMLSGHPDSPTARAHAEELLASSRGRAPSTIAAGGRD